MDIKKAAASMLIAAFTVAASMPAISVITQPAQAATPAENAARYASGVYLGYVQTPSERINDETRTGLSALVSALRDRTSVRPSGTAAIDIERDDLYFFPFILWPVTSNAPALSPQAQAKVQDYIDNGGVILFDTRDQGLTTRGTADLRRIIGDININPLVPVDDEHLLTQTFYLVSGVPGVTSGGSVWVESPRAGGSENVSSIILGGNNWANAWAGILVSPRSWERELAIRAGINMVMYAMTGDYKADMQHVDTILERLNR